MRRKRRNHSPGFKAKAALPAIKSKRPEGGVVVLPELSVSGDDREGAEKRRRTPVEKALVSDSAKAKTVRIKTPDGFCVHSFKTLMADLATLSLNEVTLPGSPDHRFPVITEPTTLQEKAFELLGIDPGNLFPANRQVDFTNSPAITGLSVDLSYEVPFKPLGSMTSVRAIITTIGCITFTFRRCYRRGARIIIS